MKVDGRVVCGGADPPDQREVVAKAGQTSTPCCDDDFVEVGVAGDDRRGLWFHDICNVGVLKAFAQTPNGWRREYHVANLTQPDQENAVHSSIVASSMSMTGMSSLIG
jgi:hypothetical protein